MTKVITYGTYDHLHRGHVRLLERAKELGDYLIVGVTSDDFDKSRGKINVQQSLAERMQAVIETGIPDEVIVEEYEGQKIDDIINHKIDIFTVGSDWKGYFDYLSEYCQIVYLDRTKGISSTEIRSEEHPVSLGLVGSSEFVGKIARECKTVNGLNVVANYSEKNAELATNLRRIPYLTDDFDDFLCKVDAVYIHSSPELHYAQIKKSLLHGKHVICESPIALSEAENKELYSIAEKNHLVLFDGLRTAYSTAYSRLLLLLKAGKIGKITAVDATCTSLRISGHENLQSGQWGSIEAWGPTALLPVLQLLGTEPKSQQILTRVIDKGSLFDTYTRVNYVFNDATASISVGNGVKSEGTLIISGTSGYAYVPAPWWKTDYFEIRFENPADNKRYFYQLEGEGIRYEMVRFIRAISTTSAGSAVSQTVSQKISGVMEDFYSENVTYI